MRNSYKGLKLKDKELTSIPVHTFFFRFLHYGTLGFVSLARPSH